MASSPNRAGSWPQERRVIVKAEVTTHFGRKPKDNPRFLITNLKTTPKHVYERVYCARGDAENRLKEPKLGLEIDRTSCTRFLANQFRVLMTAAAYVLMQELRLKARWTSCARAQVQHLAATLAEAGRLDRSVGSAHRHPPAARHPVRRRLAPHCTLGRRGCDLIRSSRLVCCTDQSVCGSLRLESGDTGNEHKKCRSISKTTARSAPNYRISNEYPFVRHRLNLYNRPS